ncbi:monovalent cation/H(+) antiporter subunit G [uncultured Algimonas sp.]|uniref:monovalent cation/H(+) antiporter subunit G n=1 Tax=uncultured Algimonas sp. TaxID=1547920 RepID=UPI0026197F00|nr:monovalent cation/H(+) antiporter subunit G [uncultured Algimonas sp.]
MSLATLILAAEPVAADAVRAGLDWAVLVENALDVFTVAFLLGGLFFVLAGSIGVLRLPDFYTRLHAAGVTDTLGAELILFALILQADNWQVVAKLLMVAFFLFVTSPTATHAVAHAAWRAGEKPRLGRWKAPALEDEG